MEPRRVVITGVGCVSALGIGRESFFDGLANGRSGIGEMTVCSFDLPLGFNRVAEVPGFDPEVLFDDRDDHGLDRFAQFAQLAAREALAHSGVTLTDALRTRGGVITGSCVGGQTAMDEGFTQMYREGKKRIHPLTVPRIMANAGASRISMAFGLRGPSYTLSTACSSSNHAIGMAFMHVRDGLLDLAVTGGSEAPFSFGNMKAWEALRVVAPDTCRPFCKERLGMILGEGAAMLVLEPLESARARGAEILAEIAGFGMTADASHLTKPSLLGPSDAMRMALFTAGLAPQDIQYVNAHGTATPGNDPNEAAAIHEVFGSHAPSLMVSSTKSMHGHALGAAGALEAVATLSALHRGIVPPTANFLTADPECPLDVVPNVARESRVDAALSSSFAFGGLNAVLALLRYS